MLERPEILAWARSAYPLDDPGADAIVDEIARARVVFLGETNHFVREKTDFRLWWLTRLGARKRLVVCEEIASLDGVEIDGYLRDGDPRHLDRVATFGYRGRQRTDRVDWPPIFESKSYPYAGMRTEHERLYAALRDQATVERFVGFDVDADGAGPSKRIPGESLADELERLAAIADTPRMQIESLHYLSLLAGVSDFDATRPAMAYRETVMKRRLDELLAETDPSHLVVVLAHAFHLAKDDGAFETTTGVGPGGGQASSLGHYLVQERGVECRSAWMVYGSGKDSQPLDSLPKTFDYPASSLNRALATALQEVALLSEIPPGHVGVGQLYNTVTDVDLARQADYVMFFPSVSPLMTSSGD